MLKNRSGEGSHWLPRFRGASRRSAILRAWARAIGGAVAMSLVDAHHRGIAGKELPSVVDSREAMIRPVSDL